MTKYQVPSQPHLESPDSPSAGNSPPEVDSSDWELRMARLVGLEEEPQSSQDDSASLTQPQSEPQEPPEPRDVQTLAPLSSNPFAKLGLVGAATLGIVVFAGVFLTQIMSGGKKPSTQNPNNVVSEALKQPKLETPQEQQQEEIETLKTKLALAEQAQAVKAAQQQLRSVKPTPRPQVAVKPIPSVEPRVSTRDRPTVIVQRIPTPARTVYVPRIVTVDRPVRVPQPVATRTPQPQKQFTPSVLRPPVLPAIPPPRATPNPQPVVETTPPPKPDSLQEWARLAKLGSYGQVSTTNKQSGNNPIIAQAQNIPAPTPITIPRPPVRIQYQPSSIAQRNSKSTVVGTSAKAVLASAISGETTNDKSNKKNPIVVVQLRQPLKAEDGSVAVPAKAELLTEVTSISEGGLVQLNVLKLVLRENGKRIEKSVPQDALVIRGSGGTPLIASQYPGSGGSSIGSDAMLFALGGAGKVGELINRPQRKCELVPYTITGEDDTTNNGSNTYYRDCYQDNSNPNIAAGIFDGGIRSIIPEITRRNQQANARSMQKTNNWVLGAGKEVDVFVNEATQF